jgi:hypothetical protein
MKIISGLAAISLVAASSAFRPIIARSLVFAAVMAALLTTAAHAQLSQAWKVCEGYLLNPTFEQ